MDYNSIQIKLILTKKTSLNIIIYFSLICIRKKNWDWFPPNFRLKPALMIGQFETYWLHVEYTV